MVERILIRWWKLNRRIDVLDASQKNKIYATVVSTCFLAVLIRYAASEQLLPIDIFPYIKYWWFIFDGFILLFCVFRWVYLLGFLDKALVGFKEKRGFSFKEYKDRELAKVSLGNQKSSKQDTVNNDWFSFEGNKPDKPDEVIVNGEDLVILGLEPQEFFKMSVDQRNQTIKQVCRKLSQKYHPDKAGGDMELFQQVQQATRRLMH